MKKNKILRVLSLGLIGATAISTLASCGEKKTEPEAQNEVILNDVLQRGMRLNKVVDRSNNSVTVTATTTPSTVDQAVNFSLAWADSKVTDKVTDYISLTVDSTKTKATLKKLKNFNNQIILKAVATTNSNVTATCTLDCLKTNANSSITYSNVLNVSLNLNKNSKVNDLFGCLFDTNKYYFNEGTIDPTIKSVSEVHVEIASNMDVIFTLSPSDLNMNLCDYLRSEADNLGKVEFLRNPDNGYSISFTDVEIDSTINYSYDSYSSHSSYTFHSIYDGSQQAQELSELDDKYFESYGFMLLKALDEYYNTYCQADSMTLSDTKLVF